MEAEISRLRGALAGFALNPGAGSTAPHLLDNYIPAFERLFALKKSIRDWLLTLSSLQSKSTLVIASDVEPTTPVSPRISNVAQVIGLGLFLLILLVFFLERLEERRGRAH